MKINGIYGYVHLWRIPTQLKRIMTSNPDFRERSHHTLRKYLLVMKLTTLIITVFILQVSASTKAQITLKENKASLEKVLEKIGKQSGYDFIYSKQDFKEAEKLSINLNNVSVEKALEVCFTGQPLTYEISDRTVMVKLKKDKSILDRVISYFTTIDVTGKVVDENGEPIAGATVKVKGTSISTASDGNGIFFLKNVSDDAILQISYLGYEIKEVKASKDLGSLKMELSVGKLDEVTVNAGYYKVKERELTGSISRITAKDIENQPVNNMLATMQGRMPGVSIVQNSGTPGSGFSIRIRGQNSLRSEANEPLYIIDGVPYSSESVGYANTSTATFGATSPLNNINPSDVESIEVLKDADATAIYGSRGANGVVLITTKKGKRGKASINLNASTGGGRATRFLDLMDTEQYLAMREKAYLNDGINQYPASAYDVNGTWSRNRYTNWQQELLGGTSKIQSLQGSVSGGSETTQFLLSGNFNSETTVMPGDFKYEKGGAHFTMNHISPDDKFKLQFSANYTAQRNNLPSADLTFQARALAPNAPSLYNENGELNWENNTWTNPLAALGQTFISKSRDLVTNAVLSYKFFPQLELRSSFGYTDLKNDEKRTAPSTVNNPSFGITSANSRLYTNNTNRHSYVVEPQLNYKQSFGNHRLDALVGGTIQNLSTTRLYQLGGGFSSNALIGDLASASQRILYTSDEVAYRYQAFYGRLNYNFNGRYIINLTGRRDGSSRFGPGKQFAVFGAVGAAWIFSEETAIKNNEILSFGKIRGSYGVTGSDQIGDYQYYDTYASSGNAYQGAVGLQPTRLFNPDFRWENNRKMEVALEMGFFKDHINFTAAWYRNRSGNQLVGIPLPGSTGFSSLNANLNAKVENTGTEFSINTINLNRKLKWNSSFNIAANRTKLLSFPDLETSTYANTYSVGYPLSIQKLYHFTGLDSQNGIYTFKDINGDGELSIDDRTFIADLTPKFFGGLQNTISYKGIQLDFLFQFVKQNAMKYLPGPAGPTGNQLSDVSNGSWMQPGNNTTYQTFTSGFSAPAATAYYQYASSSGAITDASYIRLKNLSLTYDLPLPERFKIKCRLIAQGQNLLTFTDFSGDPEYRFAGYLPPLRIYSGGIQIIL